MPVKVYHIAKERKILLLWLRRIAAKAKADSFVCIMFRVYIGNIIFLLLSSLNNLHSVL